MNGDTIYLTPEEQLALIEGIKYQLQTALQFDLTKLRDAQTYGTSQAEIVQNTRIKVAEALSYLDDLIPYLSH